MQITTYKNTNPIFKNNRPDTKSNKACNLALGATLGAIAMPIAPILDGDNFKEAYRNKNIAKLVAGGAAVGGLLGLSHVLASDYEDKKTRLTLKVLAGAVIAPLSILVEEWAQKEKKTIAKKWYAIAAIIGAGAMGIFEQIKFQEGNKEIG